jgi:lipoprotein-releasing system ATP-binding protein
VVVTHDPRLGARCDRLVELVDGKISSDGPVTRADAPKV